jgi:hypothetical protein
MQSADLIGLLLMMLLRIILRNILKLFAKLSVTLRRRYLMRVTSFPLIPTIILLDRRHLSRAPIVLIIGLGHVVILSHVVVVGEVGWITLYVILILWLSRKVIIDAMIL